MTILLWLLDECVDAELDCFDYKVCTARDSDGPLLRAKMHCKFGVVFFGYMIAEETAHGGGNADGSEFGWIVRVLV